MSFQTNETQKQKPHAATQNASGHKQQSAPAAIEIPEVADSGYDPREFDLEAARWPRFLQAFTRDYTKLDFRSPARLMTSSLLLNKTGLALAMFCTAAGYAAVIFVPELLGAAVDAHLKSGFSSHLWWIILGLVGCGVLQVIQNGIEQLAFIGNWQAVTLPMLRVIGRKGARDGVAISRTIGTGDAITVSASDVGYLAMINSVMQFFLSVVTVVVIAVLLMVKSVLLGLISVIALPIITVLVVFVVKPLARRQDQQRSHSSRLTAGTSDAVSGLRILRGIGGEKLFLQQYREQSTRVRKEGYRVAIFEGLLAALESALPGFFVVAALWIGANEVVQGRLSVGELVTFYGLIIAMQAALQNIINFFQAGSRAWVAAKRTIRLMSVPALMPENQENAEKYRDFNFGEAAFTDTASATTIEPGLITALVSADPQVSEAVALRLARAVIPDEPVTAAGCDLGEMPLTQLRENVILQGSQAQLFSGTLRQNVGRDRSLRVRAVPDRELIAAERRSGTAYAEVADREPEYVAGDEQLLAALEVADCHDVLSSLEDGLAGEITEKGRSLSGGQRQRVSLARAVATQAPVLVLVEPTSAVDSHTEARIAQRLAAQRQGHTTVIVTTSPIMLENVDRVVFYREGQARITGTHDELLARVHSDPDAAAYQAVISRALGDETSDAADTATDIAAGTTDTAGADGVRVQTADSEAAASGINTGDGTEEA